MNPNTSSTTTTTTPTQDPRLPVWVSLPRNDLSLAEAAIRGGASGIKVHLNAFHRASGTRFGSFSSERGFLLELAKLPARKAIMIGQDELPTALEMAELKEMGFEGFNLYLKFAQPYLFASGIRPILALEKGFSEQDIAQIRAVPGAWIEASMVDPAHYGEALSEDDLATYARIVESSGLPVLVPTQKKIRPEDLSRLKATGVSGILIGVIVAGSTPESIEAATRAFVRHA